jgi:hypothetical protein
LEQLIRDWITTGYGLVEMPREAIYHTRLTWDWGIRFLNLTVPERLLYCRDLRRGVRDECLQLSTEQQIQIMEEFPDPDDGYKLTTGGLNESGGETDNKHRFHFRNDSLARVREAIWADVLEVYDRHYGRGSSRKVQSEAVIEGYMKRFGYMDKARTELRAMRRKVLDDLPGMMLFINMAESDQAAHDLLMPSIMQIARAVDGAQVVPGFSIVRALEDDPTLVNRRTLFYETNDKHGSGESRGVAHVDFGLFTIQRAQSCGGLVVRSPTGEEQFVAPPGGTKGVCFPARAMAIKTGGHRSKDWSDVDGGTIPATWHGGYWRNHETRHHGGYRIASITFVDGDNITPCRNINSPIIQKMRELGLPLPAGVI